jgi:non-heme chloroperoxidase
VFHHGWPLSSDDWDMQMLFFQANGYRVVAQFPGGYIAEIHSTTAQTAR